MEQLLELLNELHPETDFSSAEDLIGRGILTSFDIVMLVTRIEEEFDVVIPAADIVPEQFYSAQTLYDLICRLEDADD